MLHLFIWCLVSVHLRQFHHVICSFNWFAPKRNGRRKKLTNICWSNWLNVSFVEQFHKYFINFVRMQSLPMPLLLLLLLLLASVNCNGTCMCIVSMVKWNFFFLDFMSNSFFYVCIYFFFAVASFHSIPFYRFGKRYLWMAWVYIYFQNWKRRSQSYTEHFSITEHG